MYNIQGERRGEVGDNETLKTLDFRYPVHELDAERKMQLADAKAKEKAQGQDDKEFNKFLKWQPKTNTYSNPLVAEHVNKKLTDLYRGYGDAASNLKRNGGSIADMVQLQNYTKAEAEKLNALGKRGEDNWNGIQSAYEAASRDRNADPHQLKISKTQFDNDLMAAADQDSSILANADLFARSVSTMHQNSLYNPDQDKADKDFIEKTGTEEIKTAYPNGLGGVSGTETKRVIQTAKDNTFAKLYKSPETQAYYMKLYNDKNLNEGNPILSRQQMAQDPEFDKFLKTALNNQIESSFDTVKKYNMNVDYKQSFGNGVSPVATWTYEGAKELNSIDKSTSNEIGKRTPSALVISFAGKGKTLDVQFDSQLSETGQNRDYTDAQKQERNRLNTQIESAKGVEKTRLETQRDNIQPAGKPIAGSQLIRLSSAGLGIGAKHSTRLSHISSIREKLGLSEGQSGNTDIEELKSDIDTKYANNPKEKLKAYKTLVDNYELMGVATGSTAASNRTSKGTSGFNWDDNLSKFNNSESEATNRESKLSLYGNPKAFISHLRNSVQAKPNDPAFNKLNSQYEAWNTMVQESKKESTGISSKKEEAKKVF